MKPTRAHYFYAENWPQRIWLVAWPLASAALMVAALGPVEMTWPYMKPVLLAAAAGFFTGGLVGVFVLGPMYWHRAVVNGVPFVPGDRVEILAGRDRGRVATVAEYIDYRLCVRLDDGRIFDVRKVMRVDDAAAPTPHAPAPAPTDGSGATPAR